MLSTLGHFNISKAQLFVSFKSDSWKKMSIIKFTYYIPGYIIFSRKVR